MVKVNRLAALAAVIVAFGSLVGCGPASSNPRPASGGEGTPGGAPGPSAAAISFPTQAALYATATVGAWSQGDIGLLSQLNDPADQIFSTLDSGNYNKVFTVYQCNGAAGSSICVLYNEVGDELDLRLRNDLLGQPHAVVDGQWHPITFPEDLKAYAQEALTAWLGHNTAAVSLLTGKPGETAFGEVPPARRADTWSYAHEEGGAGHIFHIFHNPAGDTIVFSFLSPGIASAPANRHGLIEVIYYTAHS
jgi:hypothetical protein